MSYRQIIAVIMMLIVVSAYAWLKISRHFFIRNLREGDHVSADTSMGLRQATIITIYDDGLVCIMFLKPGSTWQRYEIVDKTSIYEPINLN